MDNVTNVKDFFKVYVSKDNLYYFKDTVPWPISDNKEKEFKFVGYGYESFKKSINQTGGTVSLEQFRRSRYRGKDRDHIVLIAKIEDDYLLNAYRYFTKAARLWRSSYLLNTLKDVSNNRKLSWRLGVALRKEALVDILRLEIKKRKLKIKSDYSINLSKDLKGGMIDK